LPQEWEDEEQKYIRKENLLKQKINALVHKSFSFCNKNPENEIMDRYEF
jgi:hypothetical protein